MGVNFLFFFFSVETKVYADEYNLIITTTGTPTNDKSLSYYIKMVSFSRR